MPKNTLFQAFLPVFLLFVCVACVDAQSPSELRVLVFTKTAGYEHKSIPAGVDAIKKLGKENGFKVDATDKAGKFTDKNLKKYDAVIFLSTTGNVLGPQGQKAMEQYIHNGGGYMGIHAAADTEYDWPWYGELVGAYFQSHPDRQDAVVHVINKDHPATKDLPETWERYDEWYNYKNISDNIHLLAKLDESSYKGGKNGENHPIAWFHEYDGGRAFYTGMGHTTESFSEPLFVQHLLGGIQYVTGRQE